MLLSTFVAVRWVKLGCLALVGIVLCLRLNYPLAVAGYGQAVASQFVGGHPQLVATNTASEAIASDATLNQKAWQHYISGDYIQAESLYYQALGLQQQQLDPNHPAIAETLNHLGLLYWRTGNYPQAENYLSDALWLRKQHLETNPEDFVASLINLGAFYRQQGNYGPAIDLFEAFLELASQVPNLSFQHRAEGFNSLGLIFQDLGDYQTAEQALQQSLTIRQTILSNDHPQVADSLLNLAILYRMMGNEAAAKPLMLRSHTIYRNSLGDRHPRLAISLYNLALLYQSLGQESEVIPALQEATDIEETHLARMVTVGPEHQKQAYFDTLFGTTHGVHSLAVATPTLAARELALTTVLRRKGRVLDALANAFQLLRQQLIDDPHAQASLTELTAVRDQLLQMPPPEESLANYQAQYAELLQQEQALEAQLYRHSATAQIVDAPVTIAQVQAHIPKQSALIEYVRYAQFDFKSQADNPWGDHHYAAYILRADGPPQVIDLGQARPIEAAVNRFRHQLANRFSAFMGDLSGVEATGNALYQLVFAPITPYLAGVDQVLVSPDGVLNLIPFAALTPSANHVLLEDYDITYLTSGRDLLRFSEIPPSHHPALIVSAPDYGRSSRQGSALPPTTHHPGHRLAHLRFSPLPGSRQEGEALKKLFQQVSQPAEVYMGAGATTDQIKQAIAPQILHIATHGFFLVDQAVDAPPSGESGLVRQPLLPVANPLTRSGLAMAGANETYPDGSNGLLTALDLAGINLLGTQLAVLSACDTGLGDIRTGEGVYGLRRALVIAGVQSHIISLWPVEDLVTKDLMVDYYTRLLNASHPIGRHAALRQAQLAMLHSQDLRHPYYWAAFIASGDWRPLDF